MKNCVELCGHKMGVKFVEIYKISAEWGVYLPPTLKMRCFCKRSPCFETIYASGTKNMCVVLCNGVSICDSSQATMCEMGEGGGVNSTGKSTQYGCL